MPYGTPADPVGGTVITVAYAKANILDPIRWLRLMTGNADLPGSSYVVVSDSTSGTSWRKVPGDALASGAALTNLGFTPVRRDGDTGMSGVFSGADDVQWGIGNARSLLASDLNAINRSGWYYAPNTAANRPASGFFLVHHVQYVSGSAFAFQIAHGEADGSIYVRVNGGGGWLSWARVWTASNDGTASGLVAQVAQLANSIADGAVSTAAKIANGIITHTQMAGANVDGPVGTPGLRTLGTGPQQAAPGPHTHDGSTIVDGSIGTAELGAGVVQEGNIGAGQVKAIHLAPGIVDNSKLGVNAAAANLGFTPARIVRSTYAGNGAGSRSITGLSFDPLFVIVHSTAASGPTALILGDTEAPTILVGAGSAATSGTALISGGFTVPAAFNAGGVTYRFVAIG